MIYISNIMKAKVIIIIVLAILVIIQLKRINTTNPEILLDQDFLYAVNAPDDINKILKTSCYDCHSNQTIYPWYSKVAPVSWILENHILEGRSHINFSEWTSYQEKKKNKIIEECIEEIEGGNMPLKPYTLLHPDAKLTAEAKKNLIGWFQNYSNPGM